jgi:hypothetical protein
MTKYKVTLIQSNDNYIVERGSKFQCPGCINMTFRGARDTADRINSQKSTWIDDSYCGVPHYAIVEEE